VIKLLIVLSRRAWIAKLSRLLWCLGIQDCNVDFFEDKHVKRYIIQA
jgi:hypothetical protein